jgi:creatinine amidohydrolase/Fe(II)-dependent formamide hydrolase-like protein
MLLYLQSWPEIEAYPTRSRGLILPIGSTGQHAGRAPALRGCGRRTRQGS